MGAEEPKQRQELQENDNEESSRIGVRRIVSVGVAMPQPDDNTDPSLYGEGAPDMQDVEGSIGATRDLLGKQVSYQGVAQHRSCTHAGDQCPQHSARYGQSEDERQFRRKERTSGRGERGRRVDVVAA